MVGTETLNPSGKSPSCTESEDCSEGHLNPSRVTVQRALPSVVATKKPARTYAIDDTTQDIDDATQEHHTCDANTRLFDKHFAC